MGKLKFSYGTMNSGKSTLALQTEHSLNAGGKKGLLLTRLDRGGAVISSRLGLSRQARSVEPHESIIEIVGAKRFDFIIVDEAQFFTPKQIDELAELVDSQGVDVYCFGISTDFTTTLFDGSRRLFEVADECAEMPVKALCWCGEPGRVNARVVDGVLVKEGDQVVVGDTGGQASVHYILLCRSHFRQGKISN